MIVKEIGLIFVFSGIFGIVFKKLKWPLIAAYVLAGVCISPLILGWIHEPESVAELAEVAIVLMLFIIGIEMDLTRLKEVGLVASLGGIIQIVVTFGLGFMLAKIFGLSSIASSYFGCASAFSSTMLVVKILGEKHDINTLYGRIVIGILVIQDIGAIFALSVLGTVDNFSSAILITTVTAAAGLILIIVLVCGKYIFPKIFDYVAQEREVLFVITMGILFVSAFFAENQKLSMGIGSFLAGLSIARLSYRYEIIGDFKALKAFFTVLFFAALGLQLAPHALFEGSHGSYDRLLIFGQAVMNHLGIIIAFSLLAIVIKPILIMIIVGVFGYKRSTIFDTGFTLGQLSEFSLFLVAQGITAKHLDSNLLMPIILSTVLTMTLSATLLKFSSHFYRHMAGVMNWLEKLSLVKDEGIQLDSINTENHFEVLLVGVDRLGRIIEQALRNAKIRYLVVDQDPDVITRMQKTNVSFIFGDVTNHEVLEQVNFKEIKTVFSTVPDEKSNELLIQFVIKNNPDINYVCIVDSRGQAERMYQLGAHYVLVTYIMAGHHLLHNRGEKTVNLHSILKDLKGIRQQGVRHRECLYHDDGLDCLIIKEDADGPSKKTSDRPPPD